MDFLKKLVDLGKMGRLPQPIVSNLTYFYGTYKAAIETNRGDITPYLPVLDNFLDFVLDQIKSPFDFAPYHKRITKPYNFYQFGLDFIRPLIHMRSSTVLGIENLNTMKNQIDKKGNVILFANHQTEPDPQAISLLLEKTHPDLAENMIFVAGHRVVTDPLTVPFSKGRNLICIFSKNYIEHLPKEKEKRLHHNQKAIRRLKDLLNEGGHCIYIAPSGGRDRLGSDEKVEVRDFDPQSIELFRLLGKQAQKKTHFYPLALYTYDLLPPPASIKQDLGEARQTKMTPIHLNFGNEINMESFLGADIQDKKEKRQALCTHIFSSVCELYQQIRSR